MPEEMIRAREKMIYPAEIESSLFEHAEIADVTVLDLPDLKLGEVVRVDPSLSGRGADHGGGSRISARQDRISRFRTACPHR
jgi:hypothetical protein